MTEKAPEKVEITSDEIDSLIEKCDKDYLETIKKAAANIADFHKRQVQQSWLTTKNNGVMMGQRIRGLKKSRYLCSGWYCGISVISSYERCSR